MISQISHIKLLVENFEDYIKTEIELLRLKSVDKSADVAASLFASIIIALAGVIFILILSIGLSFFIGRLLGNIELGFFVMAAFWGIICTLLYISRNRFLKKPAEDAVVKKILD